jgi:hypothetical protein
MWVRPRVSISNLLLSNSEISVESIHYWAGKCTWNIFSYSWNEGKGQTNIEEVRKLNLIISGSNCFRRYNFRGNLSDDADAGEGS